MSGACLSKRALYVGLLLVWSATESCAQVLRETLSPFSLRSPAMLAPSLWRDGRNAAGLGVAELPTLGRVGVSLNQIDGAFRRPQEAESILGAQFFSEGGQRFGEWTTTGELRYERRAENGVRYANVNDAYAGAPFVWADSVGGDWQKDAVELSAALGSPMLFNFISAGFELKYDVSQGARQNGGRPLFRARNFHFSPAFAARLHDALHIGLSVKYLSHFEEGEFGATGVDFPQLIYLRGLGTANATVLNFAERRRLGDGFQLGVQAQGKFAEWSWSLSTDITVRQDSTQDLAFSPELNRTAFQFAGRFDERRISATLAARQRAETFGMEAAIRAASSEGRGTDPIFLAVNTIDQIQSSSASVSWWQGAKRLYAPLFIELCIELSSIARRDVLAETEWRTTLMSPQATLGAARRLSDDIVLTVQLSGGFGAAIATTYAALRPFDLTPILVRPDFLANSANRFWADALISIETPIAALNRATARLMLRGRTFRTSARLEDGSALAARNNFNAGLELVF